MIAGLWCSSIHHRPHKLACLWPLTHFSLTFWLLFPILFSHSINIFHIYPLSLLLLTKPPCGLWLKISLNAEIHLYKSTGCELHLIFRPYSILSSYTCIHTFIHTYITHTYSSYIYSFYIFSTLPFLPSTLSLWSTCSYFTYINNVMQCRPVLLLNILFILVLILTRPSTKVLPCGIYFFLGHVTAGSSLPVGRRVSRESYRALAGTSGQRSSTACWRYRATSTAAYRFWTLLARTSWSSKHHLAQWLQQVVLFIFKGQWHFFSLFSISSLCPHIWGPVTFLARWVSVKLLDQ